MPKVPYPYEVNGKLVTGNGSLKTNLFLIKPFLIARFDCSSVENGDVKTKIRLVFNM